MMKVAFLPMSRPFGVPPTSDNVLHTNDPVDPKFEHERNTEVMHGYVRDILIDLLQFCSRVPESVSNAFCRGVRTSSGV